MPKTTRIRVCEIRCAHITGYYYCIILFSAILLVLSVLIKYFMVFDSHATCDWNRQKLLLFKTLVTQSIHNVFFCIAPPPPAPRPHRIEEGLVVCFSFYHLAGSISRTNNQLKILQYSNMVV